MSDETALRIALAYDDDEEHVREQVSEWLCGLGAYAAGCAAGLVRSNRKFVWRTAPRDVN